MPDSHLSAVTILYTNHRDETEWRRIAPKTRSIRFGSTRWHTDPQWLIDVIDLDKDADRTFALRDIHRWTAGNLDDEQIIDALVGTGCDESGQASSRALKTLAESLAVKTKALQDILTEATKPGQRKFAAIVDIVKAALGIENKGEDDDQG